MGLLRLIGLSVVINATSGALAGALTLVLTPAQATRLLHEGRSTAPRVGDVLDLGEDFRISASAR